MSRAPTSQHSTDEHSPSGVHRQPLSEEAYDRAASTTPALLANDAAATERPLSSLSADRLISRLEAHERLAAALNEEADRCAAQAAELLDSGCATLPKTVDDPVLRERILKDILRYRQAPMRRLAYRPFSGKRTVCPRCWVMDGRRCTGPIDPTGQFYACLGCGPTWKISHLHKL